MEVIIGLICTSIIFIAVIIFLLFLIIKKKKIFQILTIVCAGLMVISLIITIFLGNRFARDYNDGPNPDAIDNEDMTVDYMAPTYCIVLDRSEENEDEITTLPLEISMKVTEYDPFSQTITVLISNQSGSDMVYGNEYSLQILQDGEWVDLETTENIVWTDMANIIQDMEERTEVYDISAYGKLDEGTYRLCKTDLYAEFRLYAEWTE